MRSSHRVSLNALRKETHGHVICYPRFSELEFQRRLKELAGSGVIAIEFAGPRQVGNVSVLGKGCVGIVVAAFRNGEKIALKIRRTDADRVTMDNEASMLQKANEAGVGPRLLDATPNFLLMEYVEGALLPEWTEALNEGSNSKERLSRVLRSVLEQALSLDRVGLDHGELSDASKHVVVRPDDSVCLVDFETASVTRRVSNVTSLCQYLFLGGALKKPLKRKHQKVNEDDLVNALQAYKKQNLRVNFDEVLSCCKLG